MNQNPNEPTSSDTPWEEAMSRDFDARVRDLHEAPLDFDTVKGKARKIRRNRRAAVAGSILGVAAVVTPIAVLASSGGQHHAKEPGFYNPSNSQTPSTTGGPTPTGSAPDYIQGRTWHQADGDEVPLPKGDYHQAGIWDDQLVTLQPWGEAYAKMTIFDDNGGVVSETEDVVGFATSSDTTILAYTRADGKLIARWGGWDGDQSVLAEDVTDSAGGESVGGAPVSVTGTTPCRPESGACLVRVNTDTGGCRGFGSSDLPLPDDAVKCFDQQDGLLSYTNEVKDDGVACGGVWSGDTLDFLWRNCDYQAQAISPDGKYVVGAPSIYDGLGYTTISVLDAHTGEPTPATFSPEGGFIDGGVSWTTDSQLLFSTYDGAQWHLISLDPETGEATESVDPVNGGDTLRPFLLIQH
jgi:hypothetical protein